MNADKERETAELAGPPAVGRAGEALEADAASIFLLAVDVLVPRPRELAADE